MTNYNKVVKQGFCDITIGAIQGVLHLSTYAQDYEEIYLKDMPLSRTLYAELQDGTLFVHDVTNYESEELCIGITPQTVIVNRAGRLVVTSVLGE